MGRLDGKVAIISGGAGGIGSAAARLFVAEGGRVVIGDVAKDNGAAMADSLGDAAVFTYLDVTDLGLWHGAVDLAQERFGPLTTMVNNAGTVAFQSVADATLEEYSRVVAVNQTGVLFGMQVAYAAMAPQGAGSIINVSSIAGISAFPAVISYVASKWAVRGMTKAAAIEMAPAGIRVNSIHPGQIDTPMNPGTDTQAIPIGRRGTGEDIAWLMVYLASDESGFTTGTEHIADGGETVINGTTAKSAKAPHQG